MTVSGEFGEKWKQIVSDNKRCVVDAENYLYYCKNCGHWENGPSLSIYAPKSSEGTTDHESSDNTIEEQDFYPWDKTDKEYKLIKSYRHVCPDCGRVMKRYNENTVSELQLKCPECGEHLTLDPCTGIMWD